MFTRVAVLVSLIACASAKPYLTSPVVGTTCSGGSNCTISWQDDNNDPSLDTFGDSTVGLYVGNVNQQTQVQSITTSVNVATTSTIDFTVDPSAGSDADIYFIRFDSINGKNGSTPYQVFSAKFTLNNMSGEFNSTVQAQINAADSSASGSASGAAATSSSSKAASSSTSTGSSRASGSSTASASRSSSSASGAGRNAGAAGGLVAAACAGAGAALLSFAL